MIIVLACGEKKSNVAQQAIDLYIGNYFKCAKDWALSVVQITQVYILSAKYGLVKATKIIAPYELRLNNGNKFCASKLKAQATQYGILEMPVIACGGQPYVNSLRQVFADVYAPFTTVKHGGAYPDLNEFSGRMGTQRGWMINAHGQIPKPKHKENK